MVCYKLYLSWKSVHFSTNNNIEEQYRRRSGVSGESLDLPHHENVVPEYPHETPPPPYEECVNLCDDIDTN